MDQESLAVIVSVDCATRYASSKRRRSGMSTSATQRCRKHNQTLASLASLEQANHVTQKKAHAVVVHGTWTHQIQAKGGSCANGKTQSRCDIAAAGSKGAIISKTVTATVAVS